MNAKLQLYHMYSSLDIWKCSWLLIISMLVCFLVKLQRISPCFWQLHSKAELTLFFLFYLSNMISWFWRYEYYRIWCQMRQMRQIGQIARTLFMFNVLLEDLLRKYHIGQKGQKGQIGWIWAELECLPYWCDISHICQIVTLY